MLRSRHSVLRRVASESPLPDSFDDRASAHLASVQIAKPGPNVGGEEFRLLHRGEMPTLRHFGPALQIVNAVRPVTWRTHQLARKHRDRGGSLDSSTRLEAPRMMPRFVVQPRRGI